jgi:hypothetical protein
LEEGQVRRDFLSAALYVAAFLPVCVCTALVVFVMIACANFLDLRGNWVSLLGLIPLALAFGIYAMLANWFLGEGWFRLGLRSHLVRSAPMYLVAMSLLWSLYRYGDTLEDAGLFYAVLCGVALAAVASDITAWLRRPSIEASAA